MLVAASSYCVCWGTKTSASTLRLRRHRSGPWYALQLSRLGRGSESGARARDEQVGITHLEQAAGGGRLKESVFWGRGLAAALCTIWALALRLYITSRFAIYSSRYCRAGVLRAARTTSTSAFQCVVATKLTRRVDEDFGYQLSLERWARIPRWILVFRWKAMKMRLPRKIPQPC